MLRAYDKTNGKEVGAVYMPAQQSGTPMTYAVNGRQFIVVADQRRELQGRVSGVRVAVVTMAAMICGFADSPIGARRASAERRDRSEPSPDELVARASPSKSTGRRAHAKIVIWLWSG